MSTSRNNWIVGVQSFHGNPYDGHTLAQSLALAKTITGSEPKHAHVDRGYRGHNYTGSALVHINGTGKRKQSRWERLWRRRRAAIEPVISHAKHDNRMIRNHLKGVEGDRINAILSGCGYNIRKLLRAFFLPKILDALSRFFRRFLPLLSTSYSTNPNDLCYFSVIR